MPSKLNYWALLFYPYSMQKKVYYQLLNLMPIA